MTESFESPAGVVELSYPAGGLGVHFPWKAPRENLLEILDLSQPKWSHDLNRKSTHGETLLGIGWNLDGFFVESIDHWSTGNLDFLVGNIMEFVFLGNLFFRSLHSRWGMDTPGRRPRVRST